MSKFPVFIYTTPTKMKMRTAIFLHELNEDNLHGSNEGDLHSSNEGTFFLKKLLKSFDGVKLADTFQLI